MKIAVQIMLVLILLAIMLTVINQLAQLLERFGVIG